MPHPSLIFVTLVCLFGGDAQSPLSRRCTDQFHISPWNECLCEVSTVTNATSVFCEKMAVKDNVDDGEGEEGDVGIIMPVLPKGDHGHVVQLYITDSRIEHIDQDSFKNTSIVTLQLSQNRIQSINVNAFRGLQDSLVELTLDDNQLTSIPVESLMYLRRLTYLRLRHNRIENVTSGTFKQTQLTSLRYVQLDDNLITQLTANSLAPLPLFTLSLDGNRIRHLHSDALPQSLWHISLRNNLLDSIPTNALRRMDNVAELYLSGNRITSISPTPNVHFKQSIHLDLSNNKLKHLHEYAFGNYRNFSTLDLSYNRLAYLPPSVFESVFYTRTLDISNNRLANIPRSSLNPISNSLQTLLLNDNNLHFVPKAIGSLRSLEELDLRANKLTTLDSTVFQGLRPSVRILHLAHNSLSEVPTSSLKHLLNLETLDLSHNRITRLRKMAFGRLDGAGTKLAFLNLAGNQIRKVEIPAAFLYLSSVAHLDLSNNQLEFLANAAFTRLTSLENLLLNDNLLAHFPHRSLFRVERVRVLRLDNNRIVGLPPHALQSLPNLEYLSMAHNHVVSIVSGTFRADVQRELRSIDVSANQLRHVAQTAFANHTKLTSINLNSNKLTTLPQLTFSNLSSLLNLDLSGNLLNAMRQSTIVDLPSLQTLDLGDNLLSTLPRGFIVGVPNLEHINLARNAFTKFSTDFLKKENNLRKLDLSHNAIHAVHLRRTRSTLVYLDLTDNRMSSLRKAALSDFGALLHLNVSHNRLSNVDANAFRGCPLLTDVRLSHNRISRIYSHTFSYATLFSSIDLSYNRLYSLNQSTFGANNVKSLDLSHNHLSAIPNVALKSIRRSLVKLNMARNQITRLHMGSFVGLGNLTELVLSGNSITTIDESTFANLPRLQSLDLSDNPVSSWHPQAFSRLSRSIVTLNVASTGLYSVPRVTHRSTLRALNISRNAVQRLKTSDWRSLSHLVMLDASHNQISHIADDFFDRLPDLQYLDLSHNRFTTVTQHHLHNMHKLRTLILHDVPTLIQMPSETEFSALRNLRTLRIYKIGTSIDWSTLLSSTTALTDLHIEIHNRTLGKQLHSADTRFLKRLAISGRSLTSITVGALQNVRGYEFELSLGDTQLTHIPQALLRTLHRVTLLNLRLDNNLLPTLHPFLHTRIPYLNSHGTVLHSLSMASNPLHCDCQLSWVHDWLSHVKRSASVEDYTQRREILRSTTCLSPAVFRNMSILDINFASEGYNALRCDGRVNERRMGDDGRRRSDVKYGRAMGKGVATKASITSIIMIYTCIFWAPLID